MLKKSLLLLMVSLLLTGATFMMYFIIERINHKRLARRQLENLGNYPMFNFDSARFSLRPGRKSIIVYFDSQCDHCQHQLDQFFSCKNSLSDSEIVLLSSELIKTIRLYAARKISTEFDNVRFAKINEADAYNTFGSLVVPQIFIYGADGQLIKEFRGETKMDTVLQYL